MLTLKTRHQRPFVDVRDWPKFKSMIMPPSFWTHPGLSKSTWKVIRGRPRLAKIQNHDHATIVLDTPGSVQIISWMSATCQPEIDNFRLTNPKSTK